MVKTKQCSYQCTHYTKFVCSECDRPTCPKHLKITKNDKKKTVPICSDCALDQEFEEFLEESNNDD